MSERWVNASAAEVVFAASASGRVLIERDALALLLVAAGFEREAGR